MENKNIPNLCVAEDCTACAACYSACRQSAIKMLPDGNGFLHPVVDARKCIGCKACEKACPILAEKKSSADPLACYLGWNNDAEARRGSSSGGMFSAIADEVLKEGGVVWGAAYDDEFKLSYQCAENAEALVKLRGSKYVQCEVGDAFLEIKEQLKSGRKVLFAGTPCHVRGLVASVPQHLQENLMTVDFVCHGVPSPKLFAEYLEWLEKKYVKRIISYNFREPKYGMNYSLATGCTFADGKHKYLAGTDNAYIRAFEQGCTLRDCCYNCKSKGKSRPSDFTMADAFGGEKMVGLDDIVIGVSALIVNSEKGRKMLEAMNVTMQEMPLENVVHANGNYTGSCKEGLLEKQKSFYADSGLLFDERVQKWMMPTKGEKIKMLLYNLMGAKFFYWLKTRR